MSSAEGPVAAASGRCDWSAAEKAVARKAFDRALHRELEGVVRETKERAAAIKEPSELWDLERWLAEQRKRIDHTYDFRYSVLPVVFAALLRDGRLDEDELRGLDQAKLEAIYDVLRR